MIERCLAIFVVVFGVSTPSVVSAAMAETVRFKVDFTNVEEAPKKTKWADPDRIVLSAEGLGWGKERSEGSRAFWLETVPVAIGLSWRPAAGASIRATIPGGGKSGALYARYGADGIHWTNWQYLDDAFNAVKRENQTFQGKIEVPYRETAPYLKLARDYARRKDVPWPSDEEALVTEILKGNPKFFETTTPFVGYVQFLYETDLAGGERIMALEIDISWALAGRHTLPKDPNAEKGRHVPWRFKAPETPR